MVKLNQGVTTADNHHILCEWKHALACVQAMWVQFAPPAAVADSASWQMYKLGRPVSPLEVVLNGSQSMHAVSDEGISVRGAGSGSWEQLNIRFAPALLACTHYRIPVA